MTRPTNRREEICHYEDCEDVIHVSTVLNAHVFFKRLECYLQIE